MYTHVKYRWITVVALYIILPIKWLRVYSFWKKVLAYGSPVLPASVTAEGEGRIVSHSIFTSARIHVHVQIYSYNKNEYSHPY